MLLQLPRCLLTHLIGYFSLETLGRLQSSCKLLKRLSTPRLTTYYDQPPTKQEIIKYLRELYNKNNGDVVCFYSKTYVDEISMPSEKDSCWVLSLAVLDTNLGPRLSFFYPVDYKQGEIWSRAIKDGSIGILLEHRIIDPVNMAAILSKRIRWRETERVVSIASYTSSIIVPLVVSMLPWQVVCKNNGGDFLVIPPASANTHNISEILSNTNRMYQQHTEQLRLFVWGWLRLVDWHTVLDYLDLRTETEVPTLVQLRQTTEQLVFLMRNWYNISL